MEPTFQMPGYRINEYVLVLQPHDELRQRISKIKDEFADKFKAPSARQTKSHISLVTFSTWEMMEEKVMQRLQTIAMGISPFKVELRDFGSFPTHSIHLNVVSKLPIESLITELKDAQRLMKLNNENKPHFLSEPHLAICRKLKPWQYEGAWLDYSQRQFTGRFIADSMLLLKRTAGQKSAYQIAKRFDFMNLPVATKQGCLFA